MSDNPITEKHHATFESIRHVDADGNEFWLARPLAKVLDYSEYRHFLPVLERARQACGNSEQPIADHFEDVLEMVEIGSGARRELPDVRLSRYACYLIVQNGDPSKPVIANGQTYFALQTLHISQSVRPELVEGYWGEDVGSGVVRPFMVRQAHHERHERHGRGQAHQERRQALHERGQVYSERGEVLRRQLHARQWSEL